MVKSKRIDSFVKRKACDEDEKNVFTSSKIEKLHENPNIEENKKQLSKVPKMNLKMQYPPNQLKDLFFAMKNNQEQVEK